MSAEQVTIPWFGARRIAKELHGQVRSLQSDIAKANDRLREIGALSLFEVQERRAAVEREIVEREWKCKTDLAAAEKQREEVEEQIKAIRKTLVATEELALLQEAGVYSYTHPLSDAVAYEEALEKLTDEIKSMTKKDGGAVLATTSWTVNGSEKEGRAMVRDFSKLMLRAFNAEADNLVRGLKPFKVKGAIERLEKVAATIEKLGKTMNIRISSPYLRLRRKELELTADFLQKQAEEKEAERLEKERLREERKVQQEIERERERLEKERQHYQNAIEALEQKGDAEGVVRLQEQIAEIDKGIADVDYRAANIRAGYVYVISNIGSFGERMVKVGLTRRLDPLDRIGAEKMRFRTSFAIRFGGRQTDDSKAVRREGDVQRAFNSPFWPFVLCSTSVGQEGLDFHRYCHAIVHWNLPSNPVDLEQREGRIHRFKGHAVRKNVAADHYSRVTYRTDGVEADP